MSNVHLILRNTDALSGTPRILRRQAKLLKQNAQVSVISDNFHPELLNDEKIKCLRTFRWPKNNLFQRHFFDWQAGRKVKSLHPDLVIGHGDTLHQDLLFMHTCVHKAADLEPGKDHAKKNASVPFHKMIFEQGSYKVLVCNSKMMKDDLTRRFSVQVPTYILYPGYEETLKNTIQPEVVKEIRESVTKGQDKIVLGVIASGNLVNRGAFELIKAIAKLSKPSLDKISLLIVGKEGKPEKLYQLAQSLGVREQVTWMNPRSDVANLISATDIVVHAAKMEAFGMSVLESMALAKPLITTSTVGCSELFVDDQKDFIIPSQSADLIAEKLEILIQNRGLWTSMGEKNQLIAQDYTWEKFDQNFLKIVLEQFPRVLKS